MATFLLMKLSVSNSQVTTAIQVTSVSVGDSSIVQTLGHHSKESATSTESIKATSDEETLPTSRKIRKHNMKTMQVGLKFFKLTLSLRKKKKQKRGISSALAVPEVLSKESGTAQEHSTPQKASEVASGSACLHREDGSASVNSKRISSSNGNLLPGSPLRSSDLLVVSQNAKRKRESSKEEQIKLQKESETILTLGLPETVGKFSVFLNS